jgi:hypothetical protein
MELSNLKTVKTFAQQTLERLGQDKIDYLMLNAGMWKNADQPGPHGSQWCHAYLVNHLCESLHGGNASCKEGDADIEPSTALPGASTS